MKTNLGATVMLVDLLRALGSTLWSLVSPHFNDKATERQCKVPLLEYYITVGSTPPYGIVLPMAGKLLFLRKGQLLVMHALLGHYHAERCTKRQKRRQRRTYNRLDEDPVPYPYT